MRRDGDHIESKIGLQEHGTEPDRANRTVGKVVAIANAIKGDYPAISRVVLTGSFNT